MYSHGEAAIIRTRGQWRNRELGDGGRKHVGRTWHGWHGERGLFGVRWSDVHVFSFALALGLGSL